MVEAPGDLPDWTNAILLQGVDGDGNLVAVLLDSTGQLYAVLRGLDGSGDPQTVKVDSSGQLYTVLKGASGESVLVDGDGYISAMLKGVDASQDPQSVKVDASGQLYTVLQGASGYAVAVDSDGYIVAVLKGQTGGTLTTIAVDEAGRIQAFVLDAESKWGETLKVGNAELAARLGSVKAWDWRGQVLVATDFCDGWPAAAFGTSGTGASVTISSFQWKRGGFSVKLVGGSDASGYASTGINVAPPPGARIGFEVCFSCGATPDYLMLGIVYQYDNEGYRSRVRIDFDNGQIQVMDSAGDYQNVGAVDPYCNEDFFHSFKFVTDIVAGDYVRVMLDNVEIDISGYSPVTLGAGSELLTAGVILYSHSGDNDYAYLDSMILTTAEPDNA